MSWLSKVMRPCLLALLLLSRPGFCEAQASNEERNTFRLFHWQVSQPQWDWDSPARWDTSLERWSLAVYRWKLLRSNERRNQIRLSLQERYQNPFGDAIRDLFHAVALDRTEGSISKLAKSILLAWHKVLALLKPSAPRNLQINRNVASALAIHRDVYDNFSGIVGLAEVVIDVTNLVGTTMMMVSPPLYLSERSPLGAFGSGSYQIPGGPSVEWGEVLTTHADPWWHRGSIHRARRERWQMQTENYQGVYWSAERSTTPATSFLERFMLHWFPVDIYDPLTTQSSKVTHVRESYRVVRQGGIWLDSERPTRQDAASIQYVVGRGTEQTRRFPKRDWCDALPCYDDEQEPFLTPPGDDDDAGGDDDDDGEKGYASASASIGPGNSPSGADSLTATALRTFPELLETEEPPVMGVLMPVELRRSERTSFGSLLGAPEEGPTYEKKDEPTAECESLLVIPLWPLVVCVHLSPH